jgi:hypothetical protein
MSGHSAIIEEGGSSAQARLLEDCDPSGGVWLDLGLSFCDQTELGEQQESARERKYRAKINRDPRIEMFADESNRKAAERRDADE